MENPINIENPKINIDDLNKEENDGCIFEPGINCDGKIYDDDEKYITKIQVNKFTLENEINISNIIKSISYYEEYFSPIIESCTIDIGLLDTKEKEKCDILLNSELKEIKLNKIKYIGRKTLISYLFSILKDNPKKFLEVLLETHFTLLDSLTNLNKIGIIHNNIKENNIICRDEDGRPIIIDFGLSIQNDFLILPNVSYSLNNNNNISKLFKYFSNYDTTYEVWCIEIIIINYIFI